MRTVCKSEVKIKMEQDRAKLERAVKEPKIQQLVEKGKITIIDFYTEWCPPCKLLSEALDRVKDKDVSVRRIDVDKEVELAAKIGIDAVPFVAVFDRAQKPFIAFTGYRDEEELRALIERARGR